MHGILAKIDEDQHRLCVVGSPVIATRSSAVIVTDASQRLVKQPGVDPATSDRLR